MLQGKNIVLGVTGSIAAYKAADVASKLTQQGARVDVILTPAAIEFVTPLTFRSVTGRPVTSDMFETDTEFNIEHVALAQSADIVVVAPASANTIAKIAAGMADNMLCSTILATKAPVVIAPAMNVNMWDNPITQENIDRLRRRGFVIVGPGHGWLAEGRIGHGRMVEPQVVIDTIKQVLGRKGDMTGKRVVVSAGGTQEPIDPVRHIANKSSGKMGYALAEAARDRGAEVTLVAAPTALPDPTGINVVHVCTAEEMFQAVARAATGCDALLMAAAVADYRPAQASPEKIKKGEAKLTLDLTRTRDILKSLTGDFVKVGFAAEGSDLLANAQKKLADKGLDMIVANDIKQTEGGFGSDLNCVTILERGGKAVEVPLLPKRQVADAVLDRVVARMDRPARKRKAA